jgi:plasmid stabilization system protein ParE
MTSRIIFSPGANADIRSIVLWYERIDPSLAFRFILETSATLWRIARFPYQFPLIVSIFRRAGLKRFRYAIYYSIEKEEVVVKAVVHQRRADSTWMGRGNGYS